MAVEKVMKRDGRIVPFDEERIRWAIQRAMWEVGVRDEKLLDKVVKDVVSRINELYDGKIPHIENIQDIVELELMRNGLFDVAKAYIIYRKKKAEIREEKKKILNKDKLDEIDKRFSINALRVLASRYLKRNEEGKIIESPRELFERVAILAVIPDLLYDERVFSKEGGFVQDLRRVDYYREHLDEFDKKLSIGRFKLNKYHFERLLSLYQELAEKGQMKVSIDEIVRMLENGAFDEYEEEVEEYFRLMTNQVFMPNTPALINAGRPLGMLSACFVVPIEDDMESIMKAAHDVAMIQKMGGGCIDGNARIIFENEGEEHLMTMAQMYGCYRNLGEFYDPEYNRWGINVESIPIYVRSFDPQKGTIVKGRVKVIWRYELDERITKYNIKTNKGTKILTSPWHPFFVLTPDFKIVEKRADELRIGDMLIAGMPREEKIEFIFDYWLAGFIAGDGSIDKYRSRVKGHEYVYDRLRIYDSTLETLERINDYLEEQYGKRYSYQKDRNIHYIDIKAKEITSHYIHLLQDIEKGLPQAILKAGPSAVFSFITGLFDAEGHINNKPGVELGMSNKGLIEAVTHYLNAYGIKARMREKPRKDGIDYVMHVEEYSSLLRFYELIGKYLQNSEKRNELEKALESAKGGSFGLPLRFESFREWAEQFGVEFKTNGSQTLGIINGEKVSLGQWHKRGKVAKATLIRFLRKLIEHVDEGIEEIIKMLHLVEGLEVVKEITTTNEPKTFYDLTVEKYQNYLAGENGMIFVHNTGLNFSKLRPEGDLVGTTTGAASGPVSFMHLIDAVSDVIKQGGCVGIDSYVYTDKGLKQLRELVINPKTEFPVMDAVYSDGKFVDAYMGQLGTQKMFRIWTDLGNYLDATYNELVLTADADGFKWKRVEELQEGDIVVLVTGGWKGERKRLPSIEDLEIGIHHNCNEVTTPPELDERLAEFLGFYVGDGAWNNGRLILSIGDNEKELVEYFLKLGEELFGLKGHVTKMERKGKGRYYQIVWYSKPLEVWFEKLGFKKEGSTRASIPKLILQSDEKVIAAFLRGLFEADGLVRGDGRVSLSTASPELAKQVQLALFGLGIIARVRESNYPGRYSKNPIYVVSVVDSLSTEMFYNKIGFIRHREKPRFKYSNSNVRKIPFGGKLLKDLHEKIKKQDKNRAKDFYKKHRIYFANGGSTKGVSLFMLRRNSRAFPELESLVRKYERYAFARITKKEVVTGEVFHLEVPETESYVVNGILVHNVRRGANMGILEVWHPDVEKFIHAKEKNIGTNVLSNFNISVGLWEDFWEALKEGRKYPLINPRTGKKVREVDPKALFEELAYMAWAKADPGVVFFDIINKRNVLEKAKGGKIRATNPCGEEPLYEYESCNLASINLAKFVKYDDEGKPYFDWDEYAYVIQKVAKYLDNSIDVNKFPLPEIDYNTKLTRRIGVGMMGLADALFKLGIPYNSKEGFDFMRKVTEYLTFYAYKYSVEAAKKRGPFPLYDKSDYPEGKLPVEGFYHREIWTLPWDKLVEEIKKYGVRNAMVTTCPPTGSVSMIADTSSGIEPIFALVYKKSVTVGEFYYVDPVFEAELKKRGLYSDELLAKISNNYGSVQGLEEIPEDMQRVFVTAMDIHWLDHILAQAEIQLWLTDSASKTINMPNDATVEDVKAAYLLAYKLGCKGVTVYRDGSLSVQVYSVEGEKRRRVPAKPSEYAKKVLKEIVEKEPWLRRFIDVDAILNGTNGKKEGFNFSLKVSSTQKHEKSSKSAEAQKGVCPVCGAPTVFESGCEVCKNCGWSKCVIS